MNANVDSSPCVRPSDLRLAQNLATQRKKTVDAALHKRHIKKSRKTTQQSRNHAPPLTHVGSNAPSSVEARKEAAEARASRYRRLFHVDVWMASSRNPESRRRRAFRRTIMNLHYILPILMPQQYSRERVSSKKLGQILRDRFPMEENVKFMDTTHEEEVDAAARKRLREQTHGEYDTEDEEMEENRDWRVLSRGDPYWKLDFDFDHVKNKKIHPEFRWEHRRYTYEYPVRFLGEVVWERMPIRRSKPSGLQACLHCAQKGLRCSLMQNGLQREELCKRCAREGRPYCVQRLMQELDLDLAFGAAYGPYDIGVPKYDKVSSFDSAPLPAAWAVVDDVTGRSSKDMGRRPLAPFVVFVRTEGVITNEELEAEVREVLRGEEKIWGGLGGLAVPDNMQMKGGLALPRWNIGVRDDEKYGDWLVEKGHTWKDYMKTAKKRKKVDFAEFEAFLEKTYKRDDKIRKIWAVERMEKVNKKWDAQFWAEWDQSQEKAERDGGSGKGEGDDESKTAEADVADEEDAESKTSMV